VKLNFHPNPPKSKKGVSGKANYARN